MFIIDKPGHHGQMVAVFYIILSFSATRYINDPNHLLELGHESGERKNVSNKRLIFSHKFTSSF
jgi:hypothetical protein